VERKASEPARGMLVQEKFARQLGGGSEGNRLAIDLIRRTRSGGGIKGKARLNNGNRVHEKGIRERHGRAK